jgi:CHAD domain-containing protein
METTQLPQSNVASLPPPDLAVIGPLASKQCISPLPAFPSPSLPSRDPNGAARAPLPPSALITSRARVASPAVGSCLAEALQARWTSYCEQLRNCQEEFSEEVVHELRVATRRLIAQLVLLGCVSPNPVLEKTRRILKRRLAALGDLRDTQVQRSFVNREIARFPEVAALRKYLEREERRLTKSAAERVGGWKTRKLETWVDALRYELSIDARGSRARAQLAMVVLRATSKAFTEAVERRQAIDLADLRTVHRMRVAFKRFRYMVESLSPHLTGLSKRQLRALAVYQRKMGIIQDLEVLQHCVADYLKEEPAAENLMRPFRRYLQRRRSRALLSFLKTADRLFGFWPPARLVSTREPLATRNAA